VVVFHTQWNTHTHTHTLDRTSLDEGSARCNIYLITHNIHNRYPCPWRYSNPQSQQAIGRKPTPRHYGNPRIYIYVHTYLLTPWSRVLLERLTGFAANQEIPRILWNPKVHYRTHKQYAYIYPWNFLSEVIIVYTNNISGQKDQKCQYFVDTYFENIKVDFKNEGKVLNCRNTVLRAATA
jgi:hypothetical protein